LKTTKVLSSAWINRHPDKSMAPELSESISSWRVSIVARVDCHSRQLGRGFCRPTCPLRDQNPCSSTFQLAANREFSES
jgi:hypothetical protein